MLSNFVLGLFQIRYPYANTVQRLRASILFYTNWFVLIAWGVLWALPNIAPELQPGEFGGFGASQTGLLIPVAFLIIITLLQTGNLRIAAWLFVLGIGVATIAPVLNQFSNPEPTALVAIFLFAPLLAAGVLLERNELLLVLSGLLMIVAVRAIVQSGAIDPLLYVQARATTLEALLLVMLLVLATILFYAFNGQTLGLLRRSQESTDRLRLVADYSSRFSADQTEDEILEGTIEFVQHNLGYPLCQIFILDEGGEIVRRIRTGLGRQEMGVSAALSTEDISLIRDASRFKQPIAVSERDERRSHLIPPSRSALLVPVQNENQVLGVLDIQSNTNRISDTDQELFQMLTKQMSIVWYQARSISDLKRILFEQEQFAERLKTQLDVQRPGSGAVASVWDEYLAERGQGAIGFDLSRDSRTGAAVIPANDLSEPLRNALEQGELFIETTDDQQIINLPIVLSDEVLGAMTFSVPANQLITERQLDMARTVTERLALALENNRLFERNREQAQRERRASDIANLLIGATNVQSVLELAAENFMEALGAVSTRVYLQPSQTEEPISSEEV